MQRIQLDHWTNWHKLNVLVILASHIDSKWAFGLQVIDFKLVPNTTGIITAEEVMGLNPQNCIFEVNFEHNKRVRLEKNNDGSLEQELLNVY